MRANEQMQFSAQCRADLLGRAVQFLITDGALAPNQRDAVRDPSSRGGKDVREAFVPEQIRPVGATQDYRLLCRRRGHTTGSGQWFLAEPSFIGVARVRLNWFLQSIIPTLCCWTARRVSSGNSWCAEVYAPLAADAGACSVLGLTLLPGMGERRRFRTCKRSRQAQ